MEQFAYFSNSEAKVMTRTHDIRDRLNEALRLVDEIASVPTAAPEGSVTEDYVKEVLSLRRRRAHFFDATLFADPAWDILLELYAAELGQRRVSIGSLAVRAAVPGTTALRWLKALEKKGMIWRNDDPMDGRRVYVRLAPETVHAMDRFFASLSPEAALL